MHCRARALVQAAGIRVGLDLTQRFHVESGRAVLSCVGRSGAEGARPLEGDHPRQYEGLAFATSPADDFLGRGTTKEPTSLRDQTTPDDQSGQSGNAAHTNGAPQAKSKEAEIRRLEEELAQLGREAMEQGGLRDPGDYAEFLARREQLEDRIHILRQLEGGGVAVGQRVTIRTEDGAEETWEIVPPSSARPRDGLISDRSPLGRALQHRRAGDIVDVPSPEGSYKVTVLRTEQT